jgi:carboxyl-terminal processing protease
MRVFLLGLFLFSLTLFAQDGVKTCKILSKINAIIQEEHYKPKPIDDSLSVYVFDALLDELDPNRNLFTKNEYQKLCKHRLELDNYIQQNDCSFMTDFVSIYQNGLERKKRILEKIQKDTFDYTTKDTVKFSKTNFPFDLEETDLEKVWKKRIRYDILEDISKLSANLDSITPHFVTLEKSTKFKILDTNLCKVNSILNSPKGLEYEIQNSFLNIFCTYFDPHTNYFSVDAKSSFMSSLSTSTLSLGLNLTLNDKEEIIIEEIVPAGPADKTGKFEKEDIILKVSNKKGDEYSVSCASLEKIGELLFSDSNTEIELTIQKKNGNIIPILLKKQVMKATSNAVFSYIAEKETKIGYINIPSFYSDFDGFTVQGCADDVAKEILKLQKDTIKGLVIDLQNNGGGSMDEAIKLVGMFIDYGPISVLVDNKNKLNTLKDPNRGSFYNGPIVLLINGNSASASEFYSAAMQDYNRAIVIGSKSMGKASMQTILPLDENNQQDFVKLTVEKFYRITGDSNQIKGIIPDIPIPVLFDSIMTRELSLKNALKHDSIGVKNRFYSLPKNNFEKIIALSNARVKESPLFNNIKLVNSEINAIYQNQKKPTRIIFKDVFNDVHEFDALWKKVKKIAKTESSCTITNNSYDLEKLKFDTYEQDINAFRIKTVRMNPYLEEAIAILNDYNNLKK